MNEKPGTEEIQKGDEEEASMAGPVDEEYISEASRAVSDLIPEDFKPMPGLKVPTSVSDGETVKIILTGTAKGGMVQNIYGAECNYDDGDEQGEQKSRGRIKIMIMGGKDKEE